MTKHTDEAVTVQHKIADKVFEQFIRPLRDEQYDWHEISKADKNKTRMQFILYGITAIIDRETVAPDLLKLFAERDRLREALKLSICSGPIKIKPSPETIETIEALPETTLLDFRMSVHTYKKLKAALAKEPESGE